MPVIAPAGTVRATRRRASSNGSQFWLTSYIGANRYTPVSSFVGPSFQRATYFRAAADYSRNIGRRLFSGVSLSGRKVAQNGPDPRTDLSASLFLRYRLGDLR